MPEAGLDSTFESIVSTDFTKIKINTSDVTVNVQGHANLRREENVRVDLKAYQRERRLKRNNKYIGQTSFLRNSPCKSTFLRERVLQR